MNDYIEIKGALVNNLKNVDVKIPRNQFTDPAPVPHDTGAERY